MIDSTNPRSAFERFGVPAILLLVTLIAFGPALHGGMLWDDSAHMTPPDLVSLRGLWRIWFEVGATQQYYPLLYSAFWFEHQVWGNATIGYHLTNMLEHAVAAMMIWAIIRRLRIPGAFLVALLFALHPVNVETVAWITEQKNTLSILFYLGAMWCYLEFDEHRDPRWYGATIGLFVMGLLTKTVIATLPAALLVILWWRNGKLDVKRDVRPLLPMLALGLIGGLVTAWLEYTMVGAHGADFQLTLIERCLLAGHVVWFYLYSLAWPATLMFYYPRWTVDTADPMQWLFPLGVLLLLGALWSIRGRTRSPLAAVLFFIGSLLPVLGFMNVYPFKFSYVADHFQYLPAIGILTLFAAAVFTLRSRFTPGGGGRRAVDAACVLLIAGLGTLSFRQSRLYGEDAETLYRATIARNPGSWVAHENLAAALLNASDPNGAIAEVAQALKYHPQYAAAYSTSGAALRALGKREEAVEAFRQSLAIDPGLVQSQFDLANVYYELGRKAEALQAFEETVKIQPKFAEAHFNLGAVVLETGDRPRALTEFDEAGRLAPESVAMQRQLVRAYDAMGESSREAAAAERVRDLERR